MPAWACRCWLSEVTCVNFFGHWLQQYCWTLWWVFIWLFKLVTWANERPHSGSMHTKGRSPVCKRLWLFRFVIYKGKPEGIQFQLNFFLAVLAATYLCKSFATIPTNIRTIVGVYALMISQIGRLSKAFTVRKYIELL